MAAASSRPSLCHRNNLPPIANLLVRFEAPKSNSQHSKECHPEFLPCPHLFDRNPNPQSQRRASSRPLLMMLYFQPFA
ncbi:hypothetical protein Mapa_001844 [Marchantia paleacea]|nr:hypothetical protein Mapa_001844 [Marchantia paleacea]